MIKPNSSKVLVLPEFFQPNSDPFVFEFRSILNGQIFLYSLQLSHVITLPFSDISPAQVPSTLALIFNWLI